MIHRIDFLARMGLAIAVIGILGGPIQLAAAGLNDTGIQFCGEATSGNNEPCTGSEPAGQDAHYGRDAAAAAGTLAKTGGGNAGFDFTKIDAGGNSLPAGAAGWSCVRDNVTGLVWEVKSDDGGLRDQDWGYSWYNSDSATNGGSEGYLDPSFGNNCGGTLDHCNTEAYAAAVNSAGLCGHTDWRLPKRRELQSIVDYGRIDPTIDTAYFPHTRSDGFWSSSPNANHSDDAWIVGFNGGGVGGGGRYNGGAVRLVRGGQ